MRPKALTKKQIDNGVLVRVKKGCNYLEVPEGTLGLVIGKGDDRSWLFVQFERDKNKRGLTLAMGVGWRDIELVE